MTDCFLLLALRQVRLVSFGRGGFTSRPVGTAVSSVGGMVVFSISVAAHPPRLLPLSVVMARMSAVVDGIAHSPRAGSLSRWRTVRWHSRQPHPDALLHAVVIRAR